MPRVVFMLASIIKDQNFKGRLSLQETKQMEILTIVDASEFEPSEGESEEVEIFVEA